MTTEYDVIIAGGGMTGLVTASSVAKFSNQNWKILVVDRNSDLNAARKNISGWTCGDAVSKRSVDYLANETGIHYGNPEIEQSVKGVLAYSPDRETPVVFDGDGYVLNRKLLGQRQVKDALKFGVEFKFETEADKLIYDNGYIVGIIATDLATGQKQKLTSKVVVDATGSASKLRQN